MQFTRDAAGLIVRAPDSVQLVDTNGGPARTLATGPVDDVAVVGGEIWIADGAAPVLRRLDGRGAPIAEPRPLWGATGEGRLIPTGAPGAGALWTAQPPAIVRPGDPGTVRVPPDAELVLPITTTRWLACRRGHVALGEPSAERWRAALVGDGQRVVDGAALFDSRAAALLAWDDRRAAPQQLIVVGLHQPVVQHRLTLVGVDAVRIAGLRGFALFRARAQLTLVDLRFGRVVGEYATERDLADVAIDAVAQTIALRWADTGELVVVSARDLFTATSRLAGRGEAAGPPVLSIVPAPAALDAGRAIDATGRGGTADPGARGFDSGDAGDRAGAGDGVGAGDGLGVGARPGGDGLGAGDGLGVGDRPGGGDGLGAGDGPGAGDGLGAGDGPGAGDGLGAGDGPGAGDGLGAGDGPGAGDGHGAGAEGATNGAGIGPGAGGARLGADGASLGAGADGASLGASADMSHDAGASAGGSIHGEGARAGGARRGASAGAGGASHRAAARLEFHRGHTALLRGAATALMPRASPRLADAAASERLLAAYLGLITALAGRAIAAAWDAGRLSFPTEGGLPYKAEVGGLLGREARLATADLAQARREVAAARAALHAAEAQVAPAAIPLTAVAEEFGLSDVARQILIAVAAPALWGEMARLYGILSNDDNRALCDELLVSQLFAEEVPRTSLARELDRDAPLLRHGILRVGDAGMRPFLSLAVEPIVLRRLRGRDVTEDLDDVRVVPAPCSLEDFLAPAAIKEAVVRAATARPSDRPPRIAIRGRVGSGRHTLLAILAHAAGRTLGVIDATPIVRELRTRGEQLRTALRRAHVLGLLPCIDGLEHLASDDQVSRELVRELLRTHPGPLAVRLPWDAEPALEPGHIAIDLPPLTGAQRVAAWRAALDRHGLFVRDVAELATRHSVGPGVMMRTAAQVAAAAPGPGTAPAAGAAPAAEVDAAPALEEAIRQHLVTRLRQTATRVHRLATWSQVILPIDVQSSVLELIARIKHHSTVYDTWGFDSIAATARGVTALFQGGPGTGKTMVATAIANELGLDLYRVDLSRIMSKWVGETEQNLAKLFDAAEDGHAIILFDEADSLFAKRTEVRSSVDRYANLEVNFLLQRLDSFEGIAILTTNFGTAIDAAFKRRLSFRLTFPFPDEEAREKLWRAHLPPQVPRAGDFDLAALARRFRLSGGYIRNAVLRAAFLAAEEHVPLTQEHLEQAIQAEFREIGKLSDSGALE